MKKVFYILLTALLAVLSSCQKDNSINSETCDCNLVPMTFTASTIETKTTLGDLSEGKYPVKWTAGDEIRVIAVNNEGAQLSSTVFSLTSGEGNATATFTGTAAAEATYFFAIYPATIEPTTSGTGDSGTIALPKDFQNHNVLAVENGFDPSRAVLFAGTDGASFTFSHGMAYFKITVGYENVESIRIACLGDERIWSYPTYTISNTSKATLAGGKSGESNNYIDLAPTSGTLTKGASYYIPVTVKGSSFGNLKITYNYTGDVSVSKTTSKLSSEKLSMGNVYDLGNPPITSAPSLTILKTEVKNIPYSAATDLTITEAYNLLNCTDADVDITCDGTVITSATFSSGTITYNISENDGVANRNGTIGMKLKTEGEYKNITVTQLYNGGAATKESHSWNFTDMVLKEITSLDAGGKVEAGTEWNFGDGLTMVTGSSTKWGTSKIEDIDRTWVATGGKYGSDQKFFQFTTTHAGTITVFYASGSSESRSLTVKSGTSDAITDSENVSNSTSDYKTVTFSSVAAGTILLYSTVNNVRIFSIDFIED